MNRCLRKVSVLVMVLPVVLFSGCSEDSSSASLGSVEEITELRERNEQQEVLAIAKSEHLEVSNQGKRVQQALEELQRLRSEWISEILTLLDNEAGHYIASDANLVREFRSHWESVEVVSEDVLENQLQELDTLLTPVKAVLDSGNIVGTPDPQLAARLTSLKERVDLALKPLEETLPALKSMAEDAQKANRKSNNSLRATIEEMKKAEAQVRAERIAKARAATEEEVTNQLAEQETSLIRAEAEKKRQEMELEEERLRAEMAREKLRSRANHPDTLKSLKPFVSKGKSVFACSNASSYRWVNSSWNEAEQKARGPLPMSLSAIICAGALKDSNEGRETLYDLATDQSNDRPDWDVNTGSIDWNVVKANQELLLELGDVLVEEGHLLP